MNEQAKLVWELLFDNKIVAVYPTFDAAHARGVELQIYCPKGTVVLRPTFFYESIQPTCTECGEVAVAKADDLRQLLRCWRRSGVMNFVHSSNRTTHGVRWAFDREYNRLIKAGWGHRAAFALACNSTFHRYVTT